MININQKVNFLAIGLLECLGNADPTQEQIDFTESLLETYVLDKDKQGLKLKKPMSSKKGTGLKTYFWGCIK